MPDLADALKSNATDAASHAARRTGMIERVVFAAVAAAILCFYTWSARNEETSWNFGQPQTDYYNLLVNGMLDGHLSLKADVPSELLTIPDPYNPAKRPPGLGLHDVSLYRGKYYLYFGPAPVVTLMLPFRVLTEIALPLPAAVLIFACVGYLVAASLWWRVRRDYFPTASLTLSAFVLIALGTVNVVPLLVRRGNIWELPLSGGYFFSSVAVAGIYRYLHATRGKLAWLALASLCLGLAIASRPTYLYATGLLVVPLIFAWRRRTSAEGVAGWIAHAAAATIPAGCVGLAIAAYNYARFGNPLEFGVAYQFSGIYEATARHFSWSYLPFNLRLYGFAPLEWSRYFPFIFQTKIEPGPAGHMGFEEPCGVIWHMAFVWFALATPLALRSRPAEDRERLSVWLIGTVALGAGTLLTLGFFYAAIGRYEADFMPAIALLAGIGALAIERELRPARPRWRRMGCAALMAVAAGSAAFMVLFSLRAYGIFQRYNPHAYARIARIGDYPAYWLQRIAPQPLGPLEFDVRFAAHPKSRREPLVSIGPYNTADHIFVEYDEQNRVRLGYARDFGGRVLSDWFAIDPQRTYRMRIEMGALCPPEEDLIYRSMSVDRLTSVTRRLRVTMDDRVLLDAYQRFHATQPERPRIGSDANGLEFGQSFSGTIANIRRDATWLDRLNRGADQPNRPQSHVLSESFGTLAMAVRLPLKRPMHTREPLVTTGESGRADFFYVEYLDATQVRFGLEHWGKAGIFSEPFEWSDNEPRTIEVSLGSFPIAENARHAGGDRIVVRVDGVVRWDASAKFYRAESADVAVGRNPLGGTACVPEFSGTIFNLSVIDDSLPLR